MAITYNISPTSADTERDGVNAHVAKNQGPSTPVKNYGGNMGFQKNSGGTGITNVRPKKGLTLKDVYK